MYSYKTLVFSGHHYKGEILQNRKLYDNLRKGAHFTLVEELDGCSKSLGDGHTVDSEKWDNTQDLG